MVTPLSLFADKHRLAAAPKPSKKFVKLKLFDRASLILYKYAAMLDFLRKRKDSIIIKILFGIIILAFVVFFGSDTLRQSSGGQNPSPASVNGVEISGIKSSFLIDSQLEDLRNSVGGKITDSYVTMVRNNIVNSLINSELVRQNLAELGLAAPQDELKTTIKNNPQFQQDGKFNTDFYLNKFLPWYQLTRGTAYETDAREQLVIQKLTEQFDQISTFTGDEARRLHTIQNTKYRFAMIKIPAEKGVAGDALPKEIDVKETPASAQKELADDTFVKWQKGEGLDEFLKKNQLEATKTRELRQTELKSVFDGTQDIPAIKALLGLTEKKPFPPSYFDVGDFYYLVKLEKLTPAAKPTPETVDETKAQLATQLANIIESAWIRDLRRQADVEIH